MLTSSAGLLVADKTPTRLEVVKPAKCSCEKAVIPIKEIEVISNFLIGINYNLGL
jgi:hypothetical protein